MDIAEKISGTIENVVYRNEDNDYCVIEIVDGDNNLITAVGVMPMPFEGENVELFGKWGYHKEFGKQFCFDSFEKTLPEDVDGILTYLSSKTVKGVGPVTALKIVNKFGSDTFAVIEEHPEWLTDIPGITMKKAAQISESFKENSGMRGVMMFCKDYMGKNEVTKVYKRLGAGAVGIIKENPYILCDNYYGLPFDKCDQIARTLNFDMSAPQRIIAGLRYVLAFNSTQNGHTCLPYDKLMLAGCEVLGLAEETVSEALKSAICDGELSVYVKDSTSYVMEGFVCEDEKYVARRIAEMDSYIKHISGGDIFSLIEQLEAGFGIEYANLQKKAIYEALSGSMLILTGGPGTGKTTVVKGLISVFNSLKLKCVLAAPTGRAAKRLCEATGYEAKTIHRMLEMEKTVGDEPRFNRNAQNPLEESVIIVDEASMIDLSLLASLFRALKRGARLILIGDSDQLPSVGAGNVLNDLIASGRINTVELNEIFRQSKESLIVTNAHRINSGVAPILNDTKNDFFFVRRERESDIPDTIADLILNRLPRTYGSSIIDQIQIITPSKKGNGGVIALNAVLQNKINPPAKFKREVTSGANVFRVGDKVMQTVNNYDIRWERAGSEGYGIFNGDIGEIDSINSVDDEVLVRFDDRVAYYSHQLLSELEHAYAITVHKSQGSEYPVVVIPMYSCAPMLMSRNLLYTAVTRAKRMVIMVGRSDVPSIMVNNKREVMRYTTLCDRIREA